jgi:hypothetical protein
MDIEKFKELERQAVALVRSAPFVPKKFKDFMVELANFLEWEDLLKELGK